jgi:hypothetical protein
MRSTTWLLAISLVVMPFFAITLGGCGSSSSAAKDSGAAGSGGSGGSGTGGTAGAGAGDAAACTPMDASAATVDAGNLWGCLESACMAQVVACAADCACNNAVLAALQCVATGGSQTTCFAPLASVGPNGTALGLCLLMSTSGCTPNRDAAAEGS